MVKEILALPSDFKFCQCAKVCKLKRPLSLSELTIKLEHRQRDYYFLLLGKICQLCGEVANCIDHCFSRMTRELFCDEDNLTILCNGCHQQKTKQWNSVHLKVFDLVKQKCGEKKFNKMWKIAKARLPWPKWNRQYVQEMLDKYTRKIEKHLEKQ